MIKSLIIVDLFGDFKTCFTNWKWEGLVPLPRSVDKVHQVDLTCASQLCRQRSPPAWLKSGGFFRTKLHLQKVTTFSSAIAGTLLFKIIASLLRWWNRKFSLWARRRLEHYIQWQYENSHDLGDYFACTAPFLVHDLVLSSGPSRWRFLRTQNGYSILLSIDCSQGLTYCWKSCPCAKSVPSNSTVSDSKKNKCWLIAPPCMAVALPVQHEFKESLRFGLHNTPFWVCRYNNRVRQSNLLCSKFEFAHACRNMCPSYHTVSFITTSMSLISSWSAKKSLRNHNSLCVLLLLGFFVSLTETNWFKL